MFPRPWSRAQVEDVKITTALYGPFSRNRVEITFINLSDKDTAEGYYQFKINENSFIKELFLDTNGDIKQAEDLKFGTASRIYSRIRGWRRDPAILTKEGKKGEYLLRVFPVPPGVPRKVQIEYYNVLETQTDGGGLVWVFRGPEAKNYTLNCSAILNEGAVIKVADSIYTQTGSDTIRFARSYRETGGIELRVDLNFDTLPIQVNKDILKYIVTDGGLFFDETLQWVKSLQTTKLLRGSELLIYLVTAVKDAQMAVIPSWIDMNEFGMAFINYIEEEKEAKHIRVEGEVQNAGSKSIWVKLNESWNYYDRNLAVVPVGSAGLKPMKISRSIECPFLDLFIRHNSVSASRIKVDTTDGFLTRGGAKLVLEESQRAMQIREEELAKEKSALLFIPYDSAPEPYGGYAAIAANIIYPKDAMEAGIEDTVAVQIYISKYGTVDKAKILKGDHDILNNATLEVIQRTLFRPAEQKRGTPVGVYISILFFFEIDSYNKNGFHKDRERYKHSVELFERSIRSREYEGEDALIEDGFKGDISVEMEYSSPEHFSLLYKHPHLIWLSYHLTASVVIVSLDDAKTKWAMIKSEGSTE